MKKILTMAMAAMFSVATFAQTTGDRVLKIKTTDGESTALMLNTVKDITVEEVTPLTMDIEVSNITETSMDIDFPMPAGCKYWLMCIQKEEITGTDLEVRNAIRQKYNDQFSESKFLRIPNFEAGTTYYIYALMFDQDGVPAGIAKTSATTLSKAQATDEFALDVTDITKSSAKISITPKDKSMTYYYKVLSETERAKLIEQYGSIQKADLQDITDYAGGMGFGIDMFLPYRLSTGEKTEEVKNLTAGTKYYLYAYGWNGDGTFTTDIYEKEFTTEASAQSNNVITVEVGDTYVDGCDVKVTTTNNDPYIVDVRSKSIWENVLSQNNGDKVAAAQYIVSHVYGSTAEAATRKGNQEFKADAVNPDTDYVLIVFGYDSGITTDVQTIDFKTKAE